MNLVLFFCLICIGLTSSAANKQGCEELPGIPTFVEKKLKKISSPAECAVACKESPQCHLWKYQSKKCKISKLKIKYDRQASFGFNCESTTPVPTSTTTCPPTPTCPPVTTCPSTTTTSPPAQTSAPVITTPTTIPVTCSSGYFDLNTGTCYQYKVFNDTRRNWNECKAKCLSEGGELASINSSEEWKVVTESAIRISVFLGGNDAETEGSWMWTDGSPVSFDNWRTGFPKNGPTANCMGANSQWDDWQWWDTYCHLTQYAVCKIPA